MCRLMAGSYREHSGGWTGRPRSFPRSRGTTRTSPVLGTELVEDLGGRRRRFHRGGKVREVAPGGQDPAAGEEDARPGAVEGDVSTATNRPRSVIPRVSPRSTRRSAADARCCSSRTPTVSMCCRCSTWWCVAEMAGVVGGQSTVQNVDLGCGDIPRHSQSLRISANVMCAGEAHPASLMLAGVSCARNGTLMTLCRAV